MLSYYDEKSYWNILSELVPGIISKALVIFPESKLYPTQKKKSFKGAQISFLECIFDLSSFQDQDLYIFKTVDSRFI